MARRLPSSPETPEQFAASVAAVEEEAGGYARDEFKAFRDLRDMKIVELVKNHSVRSIAKALGYSRSEIGRFYKRAKYKGA